MTAAASSSATGRKLIARRQAAIANALRAVLQSGGAAPEEIGHVHAHGLSTRSCDSDEARAIHNVFGGRSRPVPVAAAKSFFGNLGAGGGMVELIASLLAMKHGHLFPTLNYETPDPECPIFVAADGGVAAGESFVNVGVTPQGQASAVLIRQF